MLELTDADPSLRQRRVFRAEGLRSRSWERCALALPAHADQAWAICTARCRGEAAAPGPLRDRNPRRRVQANDSDMARPRWPPGSLDPVPLGAPAERSISAVKRAASLKGPISGFSPSPLRSGRTLRCPY